VPVLQCKNLAVEGKWSLSSSFLSSGLAQGKGTENLPSHIRPPASCARGEMPPAFLGSVKYLLYEIYPFTLIPLGRQLPRGIPKKSLSRRFSMEKKFLALNVIPLTFTTMVKKNSLFYMGTLTLSPMPSCITLKELALT